MAEESHLGVGPKTSALSHSQGSQFQPPRGGGRPRPLQLQPSIHATGGLLCSSDPSSPLLRGLNYLRDRLYPTHLTPHQHLYTRVVSSPSQPFTTTTTPVDANRPDLYSSRGAGNGFGDKNCTGGEADSDGGGSDRGKGKGESEGDTKMAMLTSQKFTLAYAGLLGVGGVMGYWKGGSQKSLLAGGLSASLLYYVYTELPVRPVFASSMGLGISGALVGVMASRFTRTRKVFPAGVVSFVSLVMAGGYLHGILRSMH